jgi:hypothetical protein
MGHGNRIRRVKAGPDGIKIYGITGLSCHLFEYDPTAGRHGAMRDIALVMGDERFEERSDVPQGKALTFGNDNQIYMALNVGGAESSFDRSVQIARVDPKTGEGESYGAIQIPGILPIHSVQDACTDHLGNIYFGIAVAKPPTFLAAFNPDGLPEGIVRDQRQEVAPYALAPKALAKRTQEVSQEWADRMSFYMDRRWGLAAEGTVLARELGYPGYSPVIPDGESAITALVMGPERRLYGATSGRQSHLFVYYAQADRLNSLAYPIDLGTVFVGGAEETGVRSLVVGGDGRVYGGTANADGSSGRLFCHDPAMEVPLAGPEFTYFPDPFDLSPGVQIADLGVAVDGEGVLALVADPRNNAIYGLGTGGAFFRYDLLAGGVDVIAQLDGPCLSQGLLCDRVGNIYGSMGEGRLFRYQSDQNEMQTLPVTIPCGVGREHLNAMSACAWGPDGLAYGGTTTDGMLFSLKPALRGEEVVVRTLGKPTWSGQIRALALAPDGSLYGVVGRDDVISHLFRYDPGAGELMDLGILNATLRRPWTGLRFDAMATGPNGEIFLGEAERKSHLFSYIPPYRPGVPTCDESCCN